MAHSFSEVGKQRRLDGLFDKHARKTVIVPLDDSLISGPYLGLANLRSTIGKVVAAKPNGILCFAGLAKQYANELGSIPLIINLSASSTRQNHTLKVMATRIESALALGASAVAVHVNVSSRYESRMLQQLGRVVDECDTLGIPVLAIAYPRTERDNRDDNYVDLKEHDGSAYTDLVCHCVRIAAELGADVIKTQFTGDKASFSRVIEASGDVPVLIAGGQQVAENAALSIAREALAGGAAGISFGRNVFNRSDPQHFINELKRVVLGRE